MRYSMKRILIFLLFPLLLYSAAPKKYGDSKYWKTLQIKAANVYEADTNVPAVVGKTTMSDVIADCYLSTGLDIVITDVTGTLIPREISSFSKSDSTFQMYYRDPATHATNGGTTVYIQWGGNDVSVANDTTVWTSNYGGSIDHALVIHGEETSADLTSEVSYTATDGNVTYAQTGKILKAPSFNGTSSFSNFGNVNTGAGVSVLTVLAWIKAPSSATVRIICAKYETVVGMRQFQFKIESTHKLNCLYSTDGTTFTSTGTGSTIVDNNTFNHVGFTWNNNNAKLFVNGQQDQNKVEVFTTLKVNNADLYIGTRTPGNVSSFNGIIDEIRIILGALSLNQIKTQYDNQNGFATNSTLTIGATNRYQGNLHKKKNFGWMDSWMIWSRRALRY